MRALASLYRAVWESNGSGSPLRYQTRGPGGRSTPWTRAATPAAVALDVHSGGRVRQCDGGP